MDDGPQGRASDRAAVGAESKRYVFRYLLGHLEGVKSTERVRALLDKLEADDFLAQQVELPDGFEAGARQLERYVLPATLRVGDWERYFRYLLTAITLRRLARTLDDPTILQALVRSGRLPLAETLVDRLPSAADRARGWAVLAAVCSPADPAFERLAEALRKELDTMPANVAQAAGKPMERWGDALVTAARLLAPRLRARWSGWIAGLAPWSGLGDRVRIAVAEGFFDAGEEDAPELWEVLGAIDDPDELARFLPDRLAASASTGALAALEALEERMPGAGGDVRLRWSVGLALLSRRPGDTTQEWRRVRAALDPPSWDAELLERGAAIWPRLADADLRQLAADLASPLLAVRLRLLVLEGRRDREAFRRALDRLAHAGAGENQLSLYLRALRAAPAELSREVCSRMKALLVHLGDIQYAVPPEDLARALDLTASSLPCRLRRVVDAALAAPGSDGEILRTVAETAQEEGLLSELLERAETYAAMAAADAAEGFELRADLLVLLGCRLAERDGGARLLEDVAGRLLPDEEDRLRARAARVVSRSEGGEAPELARTLASGIRDPGLQLRVCLEILPEDADPGDLVAPGNLYRVAARWSPVEDALRALGGLLEEPRQPARLAEERFEGIQSLGRKVEALADLARHSLAFQAARFRPGRQDRPAAILPLKEALGVVESDRWLLSLTPELVSIGAHLGVREAVAEIQEAVERVSGLDAVSREGRVAVLVEILGRIGNLFLDEQPGAPLGHVRRREREQRARELVLWLARLPERAGETASGTFLRREWHRLLPVLASVGERLERRVGPRRHPIVRSIPWLDRFYPSVRAALETSARGARRQAPAHQAVFDLCLASREERLAVAGDLLRGARGGEKPEIVSALAWLVADDDSGRVPALLAQIDAGTSRDRTVLELLRNAPLSVAAARELPRLLSADEDEARSWGDLWLGLRYPEALPDGQWSAAVAALLSRDRIDLADPVTIPIRRRLWTLRHDGAEAEVAEAALGALMVGGGDGGERAARLFLNASIRPSLGEAAPAEARRRYQRMLHTLEQARSLSLRPEPSSSPNRDDRNEPDEPVERDDPDGSATGRSAADGILHTFRRWSETWNRRALRPDQHPFRRPQSLAFLTGILALVVLPHFQVAAYGWEDVPHVTPHTITWVFVALGFLVVVNGLLVGGYLGWSTPGEQTVRRPVRWLRTVLASVPILGLWTIPFWTWLLSSEARWVRRNGEGLSGVGRRSIGRIDLMGVSGRLGRWTGRQAVLVGLFLVNAVLVAGASRLLSGAKVFRGAMTVGAFVLHPLFFLCMLGGLILWVRERRISGWDRFALPALSVCWLVPVPALPLAGLVGMIVIDSDRVEESLSHHAFGEVKGVRRFPGWLRLEDRLRRGWQRVAWSSRIRGLPQSARLEPELSQREQRLLWLFQGKGVALFFEAAWVAGGLWMLAGGEGSRWAERLDAALSFLNVILVLAVVVSLVGLGGAFAREILRPDAGRRIFGPRLFWGHLLGVQTALLCGLQLGVGLVRSDLGQAGGALVLLGLGGAVLQAGALLLGMVLRSVPERWWETGLESLAKVVLYSGAGLIGRDLAVQRSASLELVPILESYRLMAPVVGAALGILGLQWLRQPERQRGARGAASPRRDRFLSVLLRVTAIAPLGALAIPWWIRREARRESSRP